MGCFVFKLELQPVVTSSPERGHVVRAALCSLLFQRSAGTPSVEYAGFVSAGWSFSLKSCGDRVSQR